MFRVSSVADLEQVLADFRVHCASLTEASGQIPPEKLASPEPTSV
jgi:hypothetical protein